MLNPNVFGIFQRGAIKPTILEKIRILIYGRFPIISNASLLFMEESVHIKYFFRVCAVTPCVDTPHLEYISFNFTLISERVYLLPT